MAVHTPPNASQTPAHGMSIVTPASSTSAPMPSSPRRMSIAPMATVAIMARACAAASVGPSVTAAIDPTSATIHAP